MSGCLATICSPWRFGMDITCTGAADHEGRHHFPFYPGQYSGIDYVEWSGQNDKLTERERRRLERIAERTAR